MKGADGNEITEILGSSDEGQTTEEQITEMFEEDFGPGEETPGAEEKVGETGTPAEGEESETETPEVEAEAQEPEAEESEEMSSEETPDGEEGGEEGEPAETEVSDSMAQLQTQNDALLKRIEELSGGPTPPTQPAETPTPAPAPEPEVAQPIPQSGVVQPTSKVAEFLADVDYDQISESKEAFVKFIRDALQAQQLDTTQQVLQSIPGVVGTFVQRQTAFRDVAKEFFIQHPELKSVKRYVANVANEVAAAEPGLTIQQVLEKAAEVSRETLKIVKTVQQKGKKKAASTAGLPGGTKSGGRTPAKPSGGLQAEIDELLTD